jgi:predicted porin
MLSSSKCCAAATAILAAMAPFGARAQDTVTLYGIVDAYGQYLSGHSRDVRIQSGGISGSRFGLRGQEDLGGNLHALFTFEGGFNVDDGTSTQNEFWGRQTFVGLQSKDWGQLTLGRQYSSLYYITTDFSEFSNVAGPSTAVIGGFGGYEPVRGSTDSASGNGGPTRVNNSIRYQSLEWNGLSGGALAGLGETAGDTHDNRLLDAWGNYSVGPATVMISLLDDKGGPVNPTASRRTFSMGASYKYGDLRALAGYLDVNDRGTNRDGSGWWIGSDYRFGAQRLKAQYVQSRPKNLSDARSQAFGVGWEYAMSKRTTLYASLTRYENQDQAGVGRASFAIPAGLTSTGNNDIDECLGGVRIIF